MLGSLDVHVTPAASTPDSLATTKDLLCPTTSFSVAGVTLRAIEGAVRVTRTPFEVLFPAPSIACRMTLFIPVFKGTVHDTLPLMGDVTTLLHVTLLTPDKPSVTFPVTTTLDALVVVPSPGPLNETVADDLSMLTVSRGKFIAPSRNCGLVKLVKKYQERRRLKSNGLLKKRPRSVSKQTKR